MDLNFNKTTQLTLVKLFNRIKLHVTLTATLSLLAAVASNAQLPDFQQPTSTIKLFLPFSVGTNSSLKDQLVGLLAKQKMQHLQPVFSNHWHQYQQAIKNGVHGLFLAEPHFSAWAIHQHHFKPILRVSDSLHYVIAVRHADEHLFEVNDLANRRVCTDKPLTLSYLLVNRVFSNSWLSAKVVTTDQILNEINKPSLHCEAFILADHLFHQLNLESPDTYIRLQQGQKHNNVAFITHPKITQPEINRIKQVLLSKEVQELLNPLLQKYAAKPKLIESTTQDYPSEYYYDLSRYWKY